MLLFIGKIILTSIIIAFVSWFSGKKTALAGFLTALPLTSLLALAFSELQYKDPKQSVLYAKSIFAAVPISLVFFIPFLLAEKFNLGFWTCYFFGILLLSAGYFIHSSFSNNL